MTDPELERLAAELGREAAGTVDSERVATRVLARLEQEKVVALAPRRRVVRWVVGLAAAALLVLAGRLTFTPGSEPVEPTRQTVLHELDQLDEEQLEELLEIMPVTAATGAPEGGSLEEMDTVNLERLLRSLEG